jgi:hypothetical protein
MGWGWDKPADHVCSVSHYLEQENDDSAFPSKRCFVYVNIHRRKVFQLLSEISSKTTFSFGSSGEVEKKAK